MAKRQKVTAQILSERIDEILQSPEFYQSRESGKRFYTDGKFVMMLVAYLSQDAKTIKQNAGRFGMSPATLERIIGGGPLSDNMLGRIRSALLVEISEIEKKSIYTGDWRQATPAKVSAAIFDVSNKLVFLKKVIDESNSLAMEESPIDEIQIRQLIALLSATLEALKAPFVEKKQLSGFFRWLSRLTKVSVEKGVEKVVTDAMGDAVSAGTDLVHHLSSHAGISDLGNLIT